MFCCCLCFSRQQRSGAPSIASYLSRWVGCTPLPLLCSYRALSISDSVPVYPLPSTQTPQNPSRSLPLDGLRSETGRRRAAIKTATVAPPTALPQENGPESHGKPRNLPGIAGIHITNTTCSVLYLTHPIGGVTFTTARLQIHPAFNVRSSLLAARAPAPDLYPALSECDSPVRYRASHSCL